MPTIDKKAIKDLVVYSFTGKNPEPKNYSTQDVKETLAKEIH